MVAGPSYKTTERMKKEKTKTIARKKTPSFQSTVRKMKRIPRVTTAMMTMTAMLVATLTVKKTSLKRVCPGTKWKDNLKKRIKRWLLGDRPLPHHRTRESLLAEDDLV